MEVRIIKGTKEMSESVREFLKDLCALHNDYFALSLMYEYLERSINEKFKS